MSKPKSAKHSFNQPPRAKTTPPPKQEQGWFSRMWGKVVDFVKGLFRKVREAFSIKERTAEGKIANQSWFGKWIVNPIMAVMGWVATAVVWLARWVTYIALAVLLVIVMVLAAILLLVGAAVVAVALVTYRVIQGICLIFATPYIAYHDRAESDLLWETYWTSWHPKYWAALKPIEVEAWREFYDTVKEKYAGQDWFTVEDLWANATETPTPEWSAA